MSKIITSLCAGLVAGFVLSFLRADVTTDALTDNGQGDPVASVECVCDMHRIPDYDRTLEIARDTNSRLTARIDELQAEIELLEARQQQPEDSVDSDWLQSAWEDLAADEQPVDRQQQMIDAGFDPLRAAWLLDREAQLQLAALDERYKDAANAKPLDHMASRLAARRSLRAEIGDFEYEQYLAATGQSTAVAVTKVLVDSPAHIAGLQVGDEILDYDGVRVFNMLELSDQARKGDPNETVLMNIERNGAPMQLILPRGALGISGGKPVKYQSN